ncbi:hypothetical protein I317_06007 [Kwoniella heveanensis CBS 569]|nr:hypothetical protein I317_06007 [Kwoniella heveanensis CBS 569]
MPKVKYYAVRVGRRPGIYMTWAEAEKQVSGYPGAVYKALPHYHAAKGWAMLNQPSDPVAVRMSLTRKPSKPLVTDADLDNDDFTIPRSRGKVASPSGHPPPVIKVESDDRRGSASQVEMNEPTLSSQQQEILKRVLDGENYFFTGSAGTGKSVLLRAIINAFQERDREERMGTMQQGWVDVLDWKNGAGKRKGQGEVKRWKLGVTASTGMAGVNIGGTTVHSWAGIGLGDLPAQKLYENILRNSVTAKRWRTTGALVIDEISMIDATLFDKLESIARKVRRDDRPFGGLQLIISGDFFQLPPVAKGTSTFRFAFEADSWSRVFPRSNMSSLTRVFRQKEDAFVKILEGMRRGQIAPENVQVLRGLNRQVQYPKGIEPVGLYPLKSEVAAINEARLSALKTPLQEFRSWDVGGLNSSGIMLDQQQATDCLNRNTIWPEELPLKIGALVMLVTNTGDGVLVNGSTGIVVDFLTISEAAEHGISPPACSFGAAPDPKIAWPVVEFVPAKYASGRQPKKVIVPMMTVDVLNASGQAEATRMQIPLILAWALTIHKSQGQTIERVNIDLNKIFVEGQTYVAISRAVSLENLEIRNFRADKIMAHPRVVQWAQPLEQEQKDEEEWDELMANVDLDFGTAAAVG